MCGVVVRRRRGDACWMRSRDFFPFRFYLRAFFPGVVIQWGQRHLATIGRANDHLLWRVFQSSSFFLFYRLDRVLNNEIEIYKSVSNFFLWIIAFQFYGLFILYLRKILAFHLLQVLLLLIDKHCKVYIFKRSARVSNIRKKRKEKKLLFYFTMLSIFLVSDKNSLFILLI